MLLRAICAFILLGILVAGLWPFHAPRNQVTWSSHDRGLFFGKYGSIVSAGPFSAKPGRADNSCAIEIWLEPKRVHSSGTILALYRADSQVTPLALRQSLGDLVLIDASQNELDQTKKVKIYVDDILSYQKPVLVTISSNQSTTAIFADGTLLKRFANFKISSQDLTGRLIVGNSPTTTDEWSGKLRGLAIYDRELTTDEAAQHYSNWISGKRPDLGQSGGAIGLYLFNEGSGDVAHNLIDSATDLLIPKRFFVLHQQLLERPWDEFRPDWNYWKDVGINVAGFVPLGFFFYAYFSLGQQIEHPAALTIILGFAVSLTIEVLQAF